MVLLDEVVGIFSQTNLHRHFMISIDGFQRIANVTAFVDGDCLISAVLSDRFLKITSSYNLVLLAAKQKIVGFTVHDVY